MLPLIALHRRYQRTCRACGYQWTVTRRQAQLHVVRHRSLGLPGGPQASYLDGAIQSAERDIESQEELAEEFRRCARCGVDDFRQRPLRRRPRGTPQRS